jgi:prevent-host-death family protein
MRAERSGLFLSVMRQVGIRALQQHASAVLRRVATGEQLEITDQGRAVALRVPLPKRDALNRWSSRGDPLLRI